MSSSSTPSIESLLSHNSPYQSAQPRPIVSTLDEGSSSPSPVPFSEPEYTTQVVSSFASSPISSDVSSASESIDADLVDEPNQNKDQGQDSSSDDDFESKRGVPPSTYRSRIAPERDLANSLDSLTASDLSIHLFNAFALKQRVQSQLAVSRFHDHKPRSRTCERSTIQQSGRKDAITDEDEPSRKVITYEEVGDPGWRPPKVWTAWPMWPSEVPREERKWEEDDAFDALREKGGDRPSAILRELLVGRVLKTAKERFRARKAGGEQSQTSSDSKERGEGSSSRPSYAVFGDGAPEGDKQPELEPVIMADDEHASSILQPSIQHILSNLDKLLTNIHRARAYYATPKFERTGARRSDGAGIRPFKNSTGASATLSSTERPPNHKKKPVQNPQIPPKAPGHSVSETSSTTSRSRKRQRSTSAPGSNPPSGSSPPHKLSRSTRSASHTRTPQPQPHRLRGVAPQDWSTVLGLASLSQLPSAAVLRATKRCADLLGEGMQFRVLHEDIHNHHEDREIDIFPTKDQRDTMREEDAIAAHGEGSRASGLQDMDAMHGGVHIDGFLQPIQGRRWWKWRSAPQRNPSGPGRTTRSRTRTAESERERGDHS